MSTKQQHSQLQNLEMAFLELSDTELESIAGGGIIDFFTAPIKSTIGAISGIFGGGRRSSSPSGRGGSMGPMGGGYFPSSGRGSMTIGQMFDIFLSRFMA